MVTRSWRFSVSMVAALAVAAGAVPATAGEELTGREIVRRARERNAMGLETGVVKMRMELINKRGQKQERRLLIRSQKRDDLARSLVRVLSPPDVAGTSFLFLEKKDADDDQYLYLPALKKVRRIASKQRNSSFLGSDFTYADLEVRDLDEATYRRLPDEELGGQPTFVVEATYKPGVETQYSKVVSWIHRRHFIPVQVQFFDKGGRLMKQLKVKRLKKISGRMVAMDSLMENLKKKHQTHLVIEEIDLDVDLPDEIFTVRELERG